MFLLIEINQFHDASQQSISQQRSINEKHFVKHLLCKNSLWNFAGGGSVKVKAALSNAVTISTDDKLGNVNTAFAEGAGEQEGKGGAAEGGNDAGGSNNSSSESEKSEKKPDDVGVGAEGNQGSDDIGIQAGGDESKNSTGGAAGAGKDSAGDAAGGGDGDKGAGAGEGGDDKGAGNAGGEEEGNKEGDKDEGSEDGKANKEQESDKGTSEYSKQGADAHNILRKIHKAPDVKSNEKMAAEAEAYAKELAATFKFEHSKSKDGENLAMSCSSKKGNELSAADATKMWYVEIVCRFLYKVETCCGHGGCSIFVSNEKGNLFLETF